MELPLAFDVDAAAAVTRNDDLDNLFESVSRLASGATTPTTTSGIPNPRRWTTHAHAPEVTRSLSAQELVTRLAASISAANAASASAASAPRRAPRVPLVVDADVKTLLPFYAAPSPPEPIDLDLYALEALPLHLGASSGLLLRFVLLEWDDARLDRLMVSLKRSLPRGAEARVSRLLIHDGDWMWRLQVTLYLGPALQWPSGTYGPTASAGAWRRDIHTRLLAAL
ncbi:unnamed protein product [Parajaminaea phylloscopi]